MLGNSSSIASLRFSSIQIKLATSEPGDAHEREADRVADAVLRMPLPGPGLRGALAASRTGPIPSGFSEQDSGLQAQPQSSDGRVVESAPDAHGQAIAYGFRGLVHVAHQGITTAATSGPSIRVGEVAEAREHEAEQAMPADGGKATVSVDPAPAALRRFVGEEHRQLGEAGSHPVEPPCRAEDGSCGAGKLLNRLFEPLFLTRGRA
jgi:hypothetical protein